MSSASLSLRVTGFVEENRTEEEKAVLSTGERDCDHGNTRQLTVVNRTGMGHTALSIERAGAAMMVEI
jgi:hypothetical protein